MTPPFDLAPVQRDQRVAQDGLGVVGVDAVGRPVRLVATRDLGRPPGQGGVRRSEVGLEPTHQPEPAPYQLGTGAGELLVEHLEGVLGVGAPEPTLEQGVAVAEHLLVVGPGRVVAGGEEPEQVVEVLPSPRRSTLDQGEVVGGEDRHPEQVQPVAGPGQGVAVDQDTVAPGPPELGVEGLVPADAVAPGPDRGPDHGGLGPVPDQRGVGYPSERPPQRDPGGGLQDRGLAGAVGPLEHRHPRTELEVGVHVPTEVAQLQGRQVHGRRSGEV